MTITIDDNVPLPEPSKPDTWVTGPKVVLYDVECKAGPFELPDTCPLKTLAPGEVLCYLVGGPLNGQQGPIKGNAKTVELEVYAADGSVASIELYALGDDPTPTFRHHIGSKKP